MSHDDLVRPNPGASAALFPTFTWGAATHVGAVRRLNEDAYAVSDRACVVADGMGGHLAGEVASQLVTQMISDAFASKRVHVSELSDLLTDINTSVQIAGKKNNTPGMGTTVVGMVIVDNGDSPSAVVFHIGDSRCYRLAGGLMSQVTADHSHVEDLVRAGEITRFEAQTHPLRNVVTRALGVDATVEAEFFVLPDEDCRLLLCSDGLSGELHEDEIWEHLNGHVDPTEAADALVHAVLDGPARDNITAIVVDLVAPVANMSPPTRPVPIVRGEATRELDVTAPLPMSNAAVDRSSPDSTTGHNSRWGPPSSTDLVAPAGAAATDQPLEALREAAWGASHPPPNTQSETTQENTHDRIAE